MFKVLKKEQTPIDMNTATQSEMEQLFSTLEMKEEISLALDGYVDTQEHKFELINQTYPNMNADEFAYQILSLLFDPQTGENDLEEGMYRDISSKKAFHKAINSVYNKFDDGKQPIQLDPNTLRVAKFDDFIKSVFKLPWLYEQEVEINERFHMAFAFIKNLEDLFFYIISVPSLTGYGAMGEPLFRNILYVVFDFEKDEDIALAGKINVANFPMVEQPKDWEEDEAGGYHTPIHNKSTKNRGASDQPQEVLDILNEYQSQAYYVTQEANLNGYRNYIRRKQQKMLVKDGDIMSDEVEEKIESIVKNTTTTFQYVLDLYQYTRDFYFEFQYDFRSRLYSTGYDINLQSDSYKKGMLRPAESNFKREDYTNESPELKDIYARIL